MTTIVDQSICVLDFCGSYRMKSGFRVYPFNAWADWDGKTVAFGGAYADVPDMPVTECPTDKQLEDWISKHWNESEWYKKYMEVLKRHEQ